ncbi:SDR family oxidoreductase [Bacillus sp. V3B]|uniref:SDR family NAD(P)-dependent oxidoreductase n=1 Tax=Bacillus sp. V3B TaxID=2804915 RepID=UPI00210AFCDD|nr:SDR family oxidoreductase [Bacillus sp. V3B]MCQ6273787.1 SDR family oxidoreductase [Bacillus sp. V3B]
MIERLTNKNVVITGASSGVGLSIATLCAERGANVVLLARRIDVLEEVQKDLQERFSVSIFVYKLDVSNTDEVKTVFSKMMHELGTIDVLVNNAGYGVFHAAHEASIEDVKGMFDVNVIGLIACTSMVLPLMREERRGHIINIASQAGKIATPKSSVYSATKHAVLGYTNSLRMELSDLNITVTAVNTGPIETNFFNLADETGTYVKSVKRYMLKPEFVARKVVDRMLTGTREINLPRWMNAGSIFFALFPRLFERVGKQVLNKK